MFATMIHDYVRLWGPTLSASVFKKQDAATTNFFLEVEDPNFSLNLCSRLLLTFEEVCD